MGRVAKLTAVGTWYSAASFLTCALQSSSSETHKALQFFIDIHFHHDHCHHNHCIVSMTIVMMVCTTMQCISPLFLAFLSVPLEHEQTPCLVISVILVVIIIVISAMDMVIKIKATVLTMVNT